jgi:hypothetical protein
MVQFVGRCPAQVFQGLTTFKNRFRIPKVSENQTGNRILVLITRSIHTKKGSEIKWCLETTLHILHLDSFGQNPG